MIGSGICQVLALCFFICLVGDHSDSKRRTGLAQAVAPRAHDCKNSASGSQLGLDRSPGLYLAQGQDTSGQPPLGDEWLAVQVLPDFLQGQCEFLSDLRLRLAEGLGSQRHGGHELHWRVGTATVSAGHIAPEANGQEQSPWQGQAARLAGRACQGQGQRPRPGGSGGALYYTVAGAASSQSDAEQATGDAQCTTAGAHGRAEAHEQSPGPAGAHGGLAGQHTQPRRPGNEGHGEAGNQAAPSLGGTTQRGLHQPCQGTRRQSGVRSCLGQLLPGPLGCLDGPAEAAGRDATELLQVGGGLGAETPRSLQKPQGGYWRICRGGPRDGPRPGGGDRGCCERGCGGCCQGRGPPRGSGPSESLLSRGAACCQGGSTEGGRAARCFPVAAAARAGGGSRRERQARRGSSQAAGGAQAGTDWFRWQIFCIGPWKSPRGIHGPEGLPDGCFGHSVIYETDYVSPEMAPILAVQLEAELQFPCLAGVWQDPRIHDAVEQDAGKATGHVVGRHAGGRPVPQRHAIAPPTPAAMRLKVMWDADDKQQLYLNGWLRQVRRVLQHGQQTCTVPSSHAVCPRDVSVHARASSSTFRDLPVHMARPGVRLDVAERGAERGADHALDKTCGQDFRAFSTCEAGIRASVSAHLPTLLVGSRAHHAQTEPHPAWAPCLPEPGRVPHWLCTALPPPPSPPMASEVPSYLMPAVNVWNVTQQECTSPSGFQQGTMPVLHPAAKAPQAFTMLSLHVASRLPVYPTELDRHEVRGQELSHLRWCGVQQVPAASDEVASNLQYILFDTEVHMRSRPLRATWTLDHIVADGAVSSPRAPGPSVS